MSLRRKIKKWLAVGIPLAMLVGLTGLAAAPAAFADQPANLICPDGTDGYGPKIDTTGDPATVSVTADPGMLIDSYCVKAGSDGYVIVSVDPPATTVVIDHPTKDSVSHYSLHQIQAPVVYATASGFTTTAATCDSGEILIWGTTTHSHYVGTPDGTVGPSLITLTALADDGYTFDGIVTQLFFNGELAGPLTEGCTPPPPPTNIVCEVTGDGGTATNLDANGWVSIDTRSAGHAEYVSGGLHIWTDDNSSNAKVSWGNAITIPLWQVGELGIDYTNNQPGWFAYGPGINLFVTFDTGVTGTLVYEPVYGQDLWLTSGSSAAAKTNAPSTTGGNGSPWHGTIDQWLSVYPDALVTGFAFALGSGVHADGVLHSVTFGCNMFTFDFVAAPTPLSGNDVQSQTDCDTATVTVTTTPWTQGYVIEDGKWVLGDKVYGTPVVTTSDATNAELNTAECAAPEPPVVTPTVTTKEKANCDSGVVNITTTTTTPVFTYDSENRVWVEGEPTVKVEHTTRAMTSVEKADCTPVLAYTGVDNGNLGNAVIAGFLLLGAGGVAVAAVAIRRRKTKGVTAE